jgi:hypothetical protein
VCTKHCTDNWVHTIFSFLYLSIKPSFFYYRSHRVWISFHFNGRHCNAKVRERTQMLVHPPDFASSIRHFSCPTYHDRQFRSGEKLFVSVEISPQPILCNILYGCRKHDLQFQWISSTKAHVKKNAVVSNERYRIVNATMRSFFNPTDCESVSRFKLVCLIYLECDLEIALHGQFHGTLIWTNLNIFVPWLFSFTVTSNPRGPRHPSHSLSIYRQTISNHTYYSNRTSNFIP